MKDSTLPATLRRCDPCRLIFTDGSPIPLCCPRCHRPAPMLISGSIHHGPAPEPLPRPWTVHPLAKLADFWVGVFVDTAKRRLYILPLPCLGVWIQLPPAKPRLQTLAGREIRRAYRAGRNARREPGKRWNLLSTVSLALAICGYLAWIALEQRLSVRAALAGWLLFCGLNGLALYAGRRGRLAKEKQDRASGFTAPLPEWHGGGKLDWTATCDLDADRKGPLPFRVAMRFLEAVLRFLTPAGRCEACVRKPFTVEDLPSGVHLCGECAEDLRKLRERRNELAKLRRKG